MPATTPTRHTLDEVPGRVLTFLAAIGESVAIRDALVSQGYCLQEHELAWELLKKVISFSSTVMPAIDPTVRNAVNQLSAWNEPNFTRMQVTLDRLHPEQSRFIFHGLSPRQGPESVMSVDLLLDRLDALESAPERQDTRDADHAALATLAARSYTPEERIRLRGVVRTAQQVTVLPQLSKSEREKALLELYGWLTDWSTTARAVITRRDQLIRLGLAKRRSRAKAAPPAPSTTPAPAASDAH